MNLNDRKWKEFRIDNLFKQERGKESAPNQIVTKGTIPIINEIQNNNGLSTFGYGKQLLKGNAITVSVNFAQNVFYQKKSFYASVNILVLYSEKLNKYVGEFFVSCIRIANSKYNYAYKTSKERLNATKIFLPINSKGEPDYEFMEEYIKEREEKLKNQYKKYISGLVGKLHKEVCIDKEWQDFYISKIFDIKAGKRLTKANMQKGIIPFIGAADSNNGITNFVSNENSSTDKEVLGVNYNGSVVETFYHPYKCTFSDDVKRFSTKEVKGNKYIYLFLKNAILKQKCKYMYGYKFNENRMVKQKIMLPVNSKGEPDYKYMEDYMKYLEQKKLLEYLEYVKWKKIKNILLIG